MTYVDGFVVPVPADRKDEYREVARKASAVFLGCGALHVVECWEDDVPDGKQTDIRRAVQIGQGEAVVFSWIAWPSRAMRDEGMKKAMADPRLASPEMPFDGKRMIHGGFEVMLDAGK